MKTIGPDIIKDLYLPPPQSHKGDNGKLLIVAGNERYHGSLLLALKMASKIVDLIYVSSTPENNDLVRKLKSGAPEFITLPRNEIDKYAASVDVLLIGPGLGTGPLVKKTVNSLVSKHPGATFVLDADALKAIDTSFLNEKCILTPHRGEFKALFGLEPTAENIKKAAEKHRCVIACKGPVDYAASPITISQNTTGNPGMTKGGTGDVLAGLIAGLACKNDALLAAEVGLYICGCAGDRLKDKVSYFFNASDLIEEIPKTINNLQVASYNNQ